jgi:hypothetical protein
MGVLGLSKNKGISLRRRGREFGEWEFWVFLKNKGFPSREGGGSFGEIVERSTI